MMARYSQPVVNRVFAPPQENRSKSSFRNTMLYAIVNSEKVEASPKTLGKCPLCERSVFSKCGEINVWHWAHRRDESCDSWYEPETEWHKNWKLAFGKDNCEIVISKEGVRHIADIQTVGKVVIELQNSPIQKPMIRRREHFYGERMLWVVNGLYFKHNFRILSSDIDDDAPFYPQHNYVQTQHSAVDRNTGELVPPPKREFMFVWSWPRKSWMDVRRPLFIDFGDADLYWVESGMGTSHGRGRQISKATFLKKYGGDTDFLATLVTNK